MTSGADLRAIVDLARGEGEGASCNEALRTAVSQAIERRRGADAPSAPAFGPLTVRRQGLPDWWGADNLLLAAPGVEPKLAAGLVVGSRAGNLAVVGADADIGNLVFVGDHNLIVMGDRVKMVMGEFTAMNAGTLMIGEDSTAVCWARLDARNGGAILVGADGMWSDHVRLFTDDMHAIRTLDDGRRTNGYGGRIVVGAHVWLGERVWLSDGAHVGRDSVVGYGGFVSGALPAGSVSVSVGSPARPIRHGVTWTREDLP